MAGLDSVMYYTLVSLAALPPKVELFFVGLFSTSLNQVVKSLYDVVMQAVNGHPCRART